MSLLRGRIYNRSKKAVGAPSGNKNRVVQRGQNDPIEKTAEKVAAKHGVSPATIKRDGKFAEAWEAEQAKLRQLANLKVGNAVKDSSARSGNITGTGDSRDKAGASVGGAVKIGPAAGWDRATGGWIFPQYLGAYFSAQ